jgi:hypothetical protein
MDISEINWGNDAYQKRIEVLSNLLSPWVAGFREGLSGITDIAWIVNIGGYKILNNDVLAFSLDIEPDNLLDAYLNLNFQLLESGEWITEFSVMSLNISDENDPMYEQNMGLKAEAKAAMFSVLGKDFYGIVFDTPEENFTIAMGVIIELLGALAEIKDDPENGDEW